MEDVLVLSKTWEPMETKSWDEAFTVLFGGTGNKKAEVVEYSDRFVVHSSSGDGELKEWRVPSVIRFVNAMVPQLKGIRFSRENVYARDKGKCQYCGKAVGLSEFEYEHVIPFSRGGKTTWENIVVACTPCNQTKGNRTPAEAGMRLLSKPVKPTRLTRRRVILAWKPGMPTSWQGYMRDAAYWKGELENDNA